MSSSKLPELKYETHEISVEIGTQTLKLTTIRDLNQTIDDLFKELERSGRPDLLEKLCPYFGVIWPAAYGLSKVVQRLIPRESQVYEVGCGLAIPSLIAAQNGAIVTATDFHPEVPVFLKKNLISNSVQVTYQEQDWTQPDGLSSTRMDWDWIIGSDILYESHYPKPLAHRLEQIASPRSQLLIADPGRPYIQNFVTEMHQLGFKSETLIERVPGPEAGIGTGEPPIPKEVFVFRFFRG